MRTPHATPSSLFLEGQAHARVPFFLLAPAFPPLNKICPIYGVLKNKADAVTPPSSSLLQKLDLERKKPTSPQKGKHHLHPTPLSSLLNHPCPSLLEHQLVQFLVRSFDQVKKQLVERFEPTLCMACILSNCYDTKKQHQYKNRATLVEKENTGPLRLCRCIATRNLLGFLSYPIIRCLGFMSNPDQEKSNLTT